MASQVAHIIYAQKYFTKYPSTINKDEFMLGCTFPDIRRVDEELRRRDTHARFDPVDLNFSRLSSFEAGWKFHVYCDMRREEILNKYKFYSFKNTIEYQQHPAKMLEDELLYERYNNWEKLVQYFNNAPFFETGLDVPHETMAHWYSIIARYFEKKPDNRSMRTFLFKRVVPTENVDEMLAIVDKLRKDAKVVDVLKKVAEEIV